jgi:peptide deformylase
MIREIVTYPDKRLKEQSQDVVKFDEELHTLLDDMYDTMLAKEGVGLAAIQIGVPLNVLIINLPNEEGEQNEEDLVEAINPKILHKEGSIKFKEGCLSVPDYNEDVVRAKKVQIEYFDRKGQKIIQEYEEFFAVAWQHEMDHLHGKLFIEKLSIIKRKKFEKEFKKRGKKKKNTL